MLPAGFSLVLEAKMEPNLSDDASRAHDRVPIPALCIWLDEVLKPASQMSPGKRVELSSAIWSEIRNSRLKYFGAESTYEAAIAVAGGELVVVGFGYEIYFRFYDDGSRFGAHDPSTWPPKPPDKPSRRRRPSDSDYLDDDSTRQNALEDGMSIMIINARCSVTNAGSLVDLWCSRQYGFGQAVRWDKRKFIVSPKQQPKFVYTDIRDVKERPPVPTWH
jgi:hypothetical protein